MSPIEIFIAYSHKDLAFKDELRVQLRPLTRTGRARLWDDHDIEAGREWDAAIKENLFGAQIILLLVSPDSLDSDYFYGQEVAVSLERHKRGEAVVVPVILRACLWQQTPLGALEALPTKGRPVASWPSRDDAWHAVAQEVSELVEARQAELERLSALEQQRRQFDAAVEAAQQLFQNQNWPEARLAFHDALVLFSEGFSPAKTALQEKIDACDARLREADAQTRREQEAQARLAETERQRLEAARRAEQRQAEPAAQPPHRRLYAGLALAAFLLLAVVVWRPWQNAGRPPAAQPANTVTDPGKTLVNPVEQAFSDAKTKGTIPALTEFIQRYPNTNQAAEARNLLDQKQKLWQAARNNAQLYLDERDYSKARQHLQRALDLDPGDAQSRQKLDRIKGK